MAKEKKGAAQAAAQAAAAQAAPATEAPKVEVPTVNPNTKGLTQGEKVAYLGALQTERAFMMSNMEKPSKVMIDGLTMLAQATIVDIGIGEIATGTSAVGVISVINEKNYGFFRDMAQEMGVALPEFKALPAPTEEQLKKAGIAGALPGAKMITIEKKNVSKEAIEKKKEEIRATEKAVENPTEVKNPDQLKASLTAMLVKPVADEENKTKPDPRVQRTINFYNGYLTIQANNSENKEEELKKVKAKSRIQLLEEISEIVGPCPFALSGIAKFLRNRAFETGSPISAYTFYRRCAIAKGDETDDQYVADIVRTILIWSCKSNIAEFTKQFNAQTQGQDGMIIPVVITVYADRSFSFVTKTPPAAVLLKKAAKIQSGSGEPNKKKVAKVTKDDLRQIAETKMPDLNAGSIEAAMSMIAGTARSMGIEVEE